MTDSIIIVMTLTLRISNQILATKLRFKIFQSKKILIILTLKLKFMYYFKLQTSATMLISKKVLKTIFLNPVTSYFNTQLSKHYHFTEKIHEKINNKYKTDD